MAAKVPKLIQDEIDQYLHRIEPNDILLPLYVSITKKLTVGAELTVSGEVTSNADTFSINLMKGECLPERFPESGVLLHFNPRLKKKFVVRNSAVNGKWQKEERKGEYFPFSKGGDFQVAIRMQTLGYKILVDNEHFCDFVRKETQCSLARYIHIAGDVRIKSVEVRYPSLPEAPPPAVTCVYAQGKAGKSSRSASLAYFHMNTK